MDLLRRHVERLAQVPRPPGSAAHAEALRYIEQTLIDQGLTPRRSAFSGMADGVNLFAGIGPSGAPLVIVGAHYDSVEMSPGADDNASGVAAMLELARTFSAIKTRCRLVFAAYDREEDGWLGSAAHCEAIRASGGQVAAMISLEMLGFVGDEQSVPEGVQVRRNKGDFLALVANAESAHLLQHAREDPFVERVVVEAGTTAALMAGLSDHGAFWAAGFPALVATDTAMLRNPHYHLESDTPDRLDYEFLQRSTEVVAGWLRAVLET